MKTCKAPGCEEAGTIVGYCPKHYYQIRRHGRLTPEREYRKREGKCRASGCSDADIAKGYCWRHYQQVRRHGHLLPPEMEHIRGRTGCIVPGCKERHSARGYCKKHYMKMYYIPRRKNLIAKGASLLQVIL